MRGYTLTLHAASKCDDVSCTEVIGALGLDSLEDPELEKIEEQIEQCKEDTIKWRRKKLEAEQSTKGQWHFPFRTSPCLIRTGRYGRQAGRDTCIHT